MQKTPLGFLTVLSVFVVLGLARCSTLDSKDIDKPFSIYFDMNVDTLNQSQTKILDSLIQYLLVNPKLKILICGSGHPDERDYADEYDNIALRRMRNVRQYLAGKLPIGRISPLFDEHVIGRPLGVKESEYIAPPDSVFRKVFFEFLE